MCHLYHIENSLLETIYPDLLQRGRRQSTLHQIMAANAHLSTQILNMQPSYPKYRLSLLSMIPSSHKQSFWRWASPWCKIRGKRIYLPASDDQRTWNQWVWSQGEFRRQLSAPGRVSSCQRWHHNVTMHHSCPECIESDLPFACLVSWRRYTYSLVRENVYSYSIRRMVYW